MKRVLTGIKPTSDNLHIGNYFASIKQIIDFQEIGEYETFMFLANMHSLTAIHDGNFIKENSLSAIKTYLACGINPDKTYIYNPALISAHAELNWVLSCITNVGFMKRMHAYKDALAKDKEEKTTVGTFCYPILMASDILLYDVDYVPVGKDQKQHVEYARDIAGKFNNLFGDTFKLPQAKIVENLATITGIDGRKMSKSYNNYIGLFDENNLLLKKVKSIPTMSLGVNEPKNPDECNVYNILKLFLNFEEDKKIRDGYIQGGLSFKEIKEFLYEKIINFTNPIKEKKENISDEEVQKILKNGNSKVENIANDKIKDIYKKVGFVF
ncbi:tryptophan--tRNA ligase [Candidatus Vampirococcus lugosii]|uniref:Tryptophan--tRNA ligase n=1 Tax=Candidatus Vampirococcus lugosii TaxID=2789015 RepID=A0ABS5QND5_9BACT|nr:tryptophan--tRNA ligase [Candidatus Vampirococcus lugosii]MBS8122519.1 Tryptophanyl-tRNA synthetase [Candidatus Vampirococcus lugosii]